jgi:hypothetical protein
MQVPLMAALNLWTLELMAALTAARLASFVKQALEQRYSTLEIYMWLDSEIVLHWLNSDKTLRPRLHYTGLHRSVAICLPDSASVYTTPQ